MQDLGARVGKAVAFALSVLLTLFVLDMLSIVELNWFAGDKISEEAPGNGKKTAEDNPTQRPGLAPDKNRVYNHTGRSCPRHFFLK